MVSLSRDKWHYKSDKDDSELIDKSIQMSEIKPNYGFDFITIHAKSTLYVIENKFLRKIYWLFRHTSFRKGRKRLAAHIQPEICNLKSVTLPNYFKIKRFTSLLNVNKVVRC